MQQLASAGHVRVTHARHYHGDTHAAHCTHAAGAASWYQYQL